MQFVVQGMWTSGSEVFRLLKSQRLAADVTIADLDTPTYGTPAICLDSLICPVCKSESRMIYATLTDAYAGYASAILEAFGRRDPAPGRSTLGRAPRSVLRWPQGLAYSQGKKHDQRGQVERIEVRALYGTARRKHILTLLGYQRINTSVVERPNGTSHLRNQRKGRKTLAFSNAPRSHRWMRWLCVGL